MKRILPGLFALSVWVSAALVAPALAQAPTLSERTYRQLSQAQELLGEEKYRDAQRVLDRLLPAVQRDPYEHAMVLQTYAYMYSSQNDLAGALRYFERALALDALPEEPELQMLYNLAQLYVATDRFQDGARTMETWMARTPEEPPAEAHILLANAYANLNAYAKAIPEVQKAISKKQRAPESWYQLLLAMYFESDRFREAAGVLEILVRNYPEKKQYWNQLSGIYLNINEDRKALAVLELSYKKGLMENERELLNLVNMYLFMEIPYQAAELLDREMAAGRIERNLKHLELLANAWNMAREAGKAIDAYQAAAALSNDGELYLQLAQLYLDREEWGQAIDAVDAALSKGNVDNAGDAQLIKGMAQVELRRYDGALRSFRAAREYPRTRAAASQWITHVEQELAQMADAS